jgi:hypothetical protein
MAHRLPHTAVVFTSVDGLPLHPLVVHAVVVLLPLATLGALAVAARPRWGRTYGPLVAGASVLAAVAAVVAVEAGQALQVVMSNDGDLLEGIARHSAHGLIVRTLALAFAAVAVASTVAAFRTRPGSTVHRASAWLAVAVGAAATWYAYLAGDSGARSVWGYLFES